MDQEIERLSEKLILSDCESAWCSAGGESPHTLTHSINYCTPIYFSLLHLSGSLLHISLLTSNTSSFTLPAHLPQIFSPWMCTSRYTTFPSPCHSLFLSYPFFYLQVTCTPSPPLPSHFLSFPPHFLSFNLSSSSPSHPPSP